MPGHDLRLHRRLGARPALLHEPPPLGGALLGLLEEGAVLVALEVGDERLQRGARVPDEADVGGIAQADALGAVVDLHADGLAGLREELDVGHRGADEDEGVAALHRVLGGAGAEDADAAGHVRVVVGKAVLAQRGLGDRRAEHLGELAELGPGAARALAGEDRRLRFPAQDGGGAAQLVLGRSADGRREGGRRMAGDVALVAHQVLGLRGLVVDREGDVHGDAVGERRAAGEVEHVVDVLGAHDPLVVGGEVAVEVVGVEVLQVVGADEVVIGHPRDGQERHALEAGAEQPVGQVDGAGARGGEADAELAGRRA
jgi:hypothetical protein